MADSDDTRIASARQRVAKAICCPDGNCYTERRNKTDLAKYGIEIPCYALSPDVQASASAAMEVCAKACDEYAEARLKDLDHPAIDRDYVQGERHGAMDLAQAFRAKAEGR
jgi:hypothetical protein